MAKEVTSEDSSRRRWRWIALGAVVAVAVGAVASWAFITVLRPAEDPLEANEHTYAEVVAGEVGASLNLSTVAEWDPIPLGSNQAVGVLTSIDVEAGQEITAGTQLYSVNLRPVVVAQGDIPAFRSIGMDTKGPDVKQLQTMLSALGYYGGGIDGEAGAATVRAINEWQGALGIEKTGTVGVEDVIFIPTLPTRVTLDTSTMERGAALVGGERVVNVLPIAPVFRIPVADAQATMIPEGTSIEITSPAGSIWSGVASGQSSDPETGTITVDVTGQEGAPLCGEDCDSIPPFGQVTLTSKIITVETVSGLVVPSSALITTAEGQTAVVDADGVRIPVTVEASAKGVSVISGVEEGLRVQVAASDEPTP